MNDIVLKRRWQTANGKKILNEIINCLERGCPLSSVKGIEQYVGRWDLRGAKLSSLINKRTIETGKHKLTQKFGTLKLKKALIESIDFSFADISYSYWERCNINNCIFEKTKAIEIHTIACNFINSIFRNTNLTYSYLNKNIGANSGSFKNTEFIETNLSKCIFYFPEIENCSFVDCNLKETDFDGSRFKHSKFKGTLDSLWFRGYSNNAQKSILGVFNKINSIDYPNNMEEVDFSETKLVGVSFNYGIDLSRCKFPDNENYILVKNLAKTYNRVKEIMNKDWVGEEKRIGLGIIENVHFDSSRQNQYMDLIDKNIIFKLSINV